jgi:hypothetical protein
MEVPRVPEAPTTVTILGSTNFSLDWTLGSVTG